MYTHRDGSESRPACPKRHLADPAKYALPPTFRQSEKEKAKAELEQSGHGTLDGFVSREKFSVEKVNRMLVIWIIEERLAWARMEDHGLRAAFCLANISSNLRSASWAARAAKTLYFSLRNAALDLLKVIPTLSFLDCLRS